jgi:membrane peptidoglycan carboxypeptidase
VPLPYFVEAVTGALLGDHALDAALASVDPASGAVVAMVGGRERGRQADGHHLAAA